MTPAARVQSAIEILDTVIAAATSNGPPADRVLAEWIRTHRFAGSKDKRAIRELVYGAIRACGPIPASGRAAMLRLVEVEPELAQHFDGSQYGAPAIGTGEEAAKGGLGAPVIEKLLAKSDIVGDEAAGLLGRAPLDIRVNTFKASRDTIELPVAAEEIAAPNGLRLPTGTPVEQWDAYKEGLVEVQDCGSQIACLAVGARPGQTVIDLCAGAGGKTLALAAAMDNTGTLIASDTDRGRLSRLPARAGRAGIGMIETVLLDPGKEAQALSKWRGKADAVLVDAPCTGTGTWRRKPDARWRLKPAELDKVSDLQTRLLELAATLVKPGGRVIYVVCSLLDAEGPEVVADFLSADPRLAAQDLHLPLGTPRGPGIRLTPHHDGTDGFFIACIGSA